MDHLNWGRIAVMSILPLVLALPAGYLFWRKHDAALGNITGMAIIFILGLGGILLEYADVGRWSQACLDQGHVCTPTPDGFTRYAIYAGIAMVQVFVLFAVGLKVEEHERNSHYAPEWKR